MALAYPWTWRACYNGSHGHGRRLKRSPGRGKGRLLFSPSWRAPSTPFLLGMVFLFFPARGRQGGAWSWSIGHGGVSSFLWRACTPDRRPPSWGKASSPSASTTGGQGRASRGSGSGLRGHCGDRGERISVYEGIVISHEAHRLGRDRPALRRLLMPFDAPDGDQALPRPACPMILAATARDAGARHDGTGDDVSGPNPVSRAWFQELMRPRGPLPGHGDSPGPRPGGGLVHLPPPVPARAVPTPRPPIGTASSSNWARPRGRSP
jgi:hypothetical protein